MDGWRREAEKGAWRCARRVGGDVQVGRKVEEWKETFGSRLLPGKASRDEGLRGGEASLRCSLLACLLAWQQSIVYPTAGIRESGKGGDKSIHTTMRAVEGEKIRDHSLTRSRRTGQDLGVGCIGASCDGRGQGKKQTEAGGGTHQRRRQGGGQCLHASLWMGCLLGLGRALTRALPSFVPAGALHATCVVPWPDIAQCTLDSL